MIEVRRPNPDALLAAVTSEERHAKRGRLKVFLGANAGVGKTYAMLQEARALAAKGVDVVVGVVETHGRTETEALVGTLTTLPRRIVEHKSTRLAEFDLDAALRRRPTLLLVDELAHSNAPGSRHPKRWQDIEELLDAGIDVYSTVNVQHLESLNDQVARLTGIQVWETIPDRVLREANEVELVDTPADELLARLREGKIYNSERARIAEQNFFKRSNLIALRELALRETAGRVDSDLQALRQREGLTQPAGVSEKLLACIGADEFAPQVVRETARLASTLRAPWVALYVETPKLARLPPTQRERVLASLKLAEDLGAETATLGSIDVARTVLEFADSRQVTRIVIGKPRRRHWLRRIAGSVVDALIEQAQGVDVHLVARQAGGDILANRGSAASVAGLGGTSKRGRLGRRFVAALALVVGATGLAALIYEEGRSATTSTLYLLAVVLAGLYLGRAPAAFASVASGLAYNYFFTAPRFTFRIEHPQDWLTFLALLVVGLVIAHLSARARHQARVAVQREERAVALGAFTESLLGARTVEAIAEHARTQIAAAFHADVTLLQWRADGTLEIQPPAAREGESRLDEAVARWCVANAESAGVGTHTLASNPLHYVPIRVAGQTFGVLALAPRELRRLLLPEPRRALQAFVRQVGLALQRVELSQRARDAALAAQAEDLRSALLSGLSHDLRTPLATIMGASSAMLTPSAAAQDATLRELAQTIHEESQRMTRLTNDLLDMARLSSVGAPIERDWYPIDELVGSVRQRLRPLLGVRSITTDIRDGLVSVYVDAMLFEQVLMNLLENACKYSPVDAPIDLMFQIAPAQQRLVQVGVLDRGPGVPDGLKVRVFEKFFQARPDATPGGSGLGLALCHAILRLHGGRIWVEDRPEGGAAFWIELPHPDHSPRALAAEVALRESEQT